MILEATYERFGGLSEDETDLEATLLIRIFFRWQKCAVMI